MFYVQSPHPPGAVILATGDVPRYQSFYNCMEMLLIPAGTVYYKKSGNSVAEQTETMLRDALQHAHVEWVWIIGDDHTFDPDIILKLLDRKKDAIIPLCLSRHGHYGPTFWKREADEIWMPELEELPTTGLVEAWSCGDAGLLMTREVVEATGPPWYDMLLTSIKSSVVTRKGEDFYMTKQIREKGFKLWVDMEVRMGHSMPVTAMPIVGKDGKWKRALLNEDRWIGYLTTGKKEFQARRWGDGFPLYETIDANRSMEDQGRERKT